MKLSKESITEIAIDLFLEKGYDNVTIQDICKKASITKPTFYSYIGSKDDLIIDLYDTSIKDILGDSYHFLTIESGYEQLVYIFSKLLKDTQKYGSDILSHMLTANLKEDRGSFELRKNLTDMSVVILAKAQKNGDILNQSDPVKLYTALAYLFSGYEMMWCIKDGQSEFSKDFFESFNLILQVKEEYKDIYHKYI